MPAWQYCIPLWPAVREFWISTRSVPIQCLKLVLHRLNNGVIPIHAASSFPWSAWRATDDHVHVYTIKVHVTTGSLTFTFHLTPPKKINLTLFTSRTLKMKAKLRDRMDYYYLLYRKCGSLLLCRSTVFVPPHAWSLDSCTYSSHTDDWLMTKRANKWERDRSCSTWLASRMNTNKLTLHAYIIRRSISPIIRVLYIRYYI
jgi:hypothetical protein